jgi:hypothetical protein
MPFVTAESLAGQSEYFLLAEILEPPEFRERTLHDAVTPEQDDDPAIGYLHRARTWMEHLDTHAESALIDLTRALELNPALEGEIRPLLERVRRKLEQADG